MPPFDARRGAEAGFPAIPAVPIAIGFHHPPQLSVIGRFFLFLVAATTAELTPGKQRDNSGKSNMSAINGAKSMGYSRINLPR
jgi:hypothetical protein